MAAELLEQLNAFYDGSYGWNLRRAQRGYCDFFGVSISEDEQYYRLRVGHNYADDVLLCRSSMDKLLYMIFAPARSEFSRAARMRKDERLEFLRGVMATVRSGRLSQERSG